MSSYKIYGVSYELQPNASEYPDAFAIKGDLVDEEPKGKLLGYITMEDGSTVACYKRFNKALVIVPLLILLLGGGGAFAYLFFIQPKDVVNPISGMVVKEQMTHNVVEYNAFMTVTENGADLNFVNGSEQAVVQLIGEGIESQPVTVEAYSTVGNIPVTYTTYNGLVEAILRITTPTSSTEQQVILEIPANNTPNSPESSLDGYWRGEFIYDINAVE